MFNLVIKNNLFISKLKYLNQQILSIKKNIKYETIKI